MSISYDMEESSVSRTTKPVAFSSCEQELFTRHSWTEDETGLGIYDGTPTTIKKHPYLVGILVGGGLWCAGTIVSDSWIVTTGECAYAYYPSELTVVAASSDGVTGKTYQVQTITMHPNFIYMMDYDFACIQINGTFQWSSKTKPTKLPKNDPKANTKMVVAGWGQTGNENNSTLLQGNMKWLATKICNETYASLNVTWTARMACAYNKGKTTLCKGDWGDAFIFKGIFYGMFAAGGTKGFCSSDAIPVLVADINSVAPWISKVTGAKCEKEEVAWSLQNSSENNVF